MKTYIVAVSGGVDSIVLLHMLACKQRTTDSEQRIDYVVAHYDHGIRADSSKDKEFVEAYCKKLATRFESEQGRLGHYASEALAREKRYEFLRRIKDKYNAERIITAHHQDDVIETMVINMLRGTGPRGLGSLTNTLEILRPLLGKSKAELLEYAREYGLEWREDPSNENTDYLRNYVRLNLMPKLKNHEAVLLGINKRAQKIFQEIDGLLGHIVPGGNSLARTRLLIFDWKTQREIVRAWLLQNGARELDKATIERLVIAIKTLPIGKRVNVDDRLWLISSPKNVLITEKV